MRLARSIVGYALVPALAVLGASGCLTPAPDLIETTTTTDESDDAGRCGPARGVVDFVVDGDTVALATGERIRYLLIDTPEVRDDPECYGDEASEFNRRLVEGQEVSLEYDIECTDQYGRLLAYVSLGERDINALMVERGFACVLQIPPNGEQRVSEFETLESQAKADRVGMWGSCSVVGCE